MKLAPDLEKCVVFLGIRNAEGNYRWGGTAFFVHCLVEGTERRIGYLVTAYHVIGGARRAGHKALYIRINLRRGGYEVIETSLEDWKTHPTRECDIACYPISSAWLGEHADYGGLAAEMLLTEERARRHAVGTGDDIFLVGLFTSRTGQSRNIPIVRGGHIAAMPSEPIQIKLGDSMTTASAYLVEARSIGGLSGSPVFVYWGDMVIDEREGKQTVMRTAGSFHYALLGLMHGHWDVDALSSDAADMSDEVRLALNTGIGIVVPSWEILEVLNREDFVEQRRQVRERLDAENLPTPDVNYEEVDPNTIAKRVVD